MNLRRTASVAALSVGLALVLIAPQRTINETPAYLPHRPFSVDPSSLPPPSPSAENDQVTVPRSGTGGCRLTGGPARLVIPALCLDGPVVPATLKRDGSFAVPADVSQVGLWAGGAPLESDTGSPLETGTTLLAGHVNHVGQGRGTLAELYQVTAGMLIYVTTPTGRVTRWQVISATAVLKAQLPPSVFAGPSGPRLLTLVTCGGPIHHQAGRGWTYDDNVVVTAVPT